MTHRSRATVLDYPYQPLRTSENVSLFAGKREGRRKEEGKNEKERVRHMRTQLSLPSYCLPKPDERQWRDSFPLAFQTAMVVVFCCVFVT